MLPRAILNKLNNPPGFVLVAVTTVMAALLFLASYLLDQATGEIKISKNENAATKAYYLAEAGVNEAMYKLKNDSTWKTNFINGSFPSGGITVNRNNVFDQFGNYNLTVTGVGNTPGLADIVVNATYATGTNKSAKRVIKTRLWRATNTANI